MRRPTQPVPRTARGERIVEIVSDSGEGAQKAGQIFGAVCARMGNGVWTVEIIPAEIKPPARSRAGASGIRVRFASGPVSNMGDEADMVVAFNEQVLYGRLDQGAYRPGTVVLLDDLWADDANETIRSQYADARADFVGRGLEVIEVPLNRTCLAIDRDAKVGKNMFVVGLLCEVYGRDLAFALAQVEATFGKKGDAVVAANRAMVEAGAAFARERLTHLFCEVAAQPTDEARVVMNGNQAAALGIVAAGIEVVAMYPITPATSVSHHLASLLPKAGGLLHQAEDEIAAIGFALGATYAGKTAATVTSGPGLALKTEFLGLAVMAELPLVVFLVQRGGPSTGLPTKVEQGDLLAVLYGEPGDAPKVVLAPATIEECFHSIVLARKLAEDFRMPVIVLSDANLATGVSAFRRPRPRREWLAPAIDSSPWPEGLAPYAWDEQTGLSARPVPGRRGGEYVLTGLAHTRGSKVAYDPASNETGLRMRSRKLSALAATLKRPVVHGDPEGDLLVVGWGSTLGAIEEAVDRLRARGARVSSLHLRFLSPLEPGLEEIFANFGRVMTVEMNYSDLPDDPFVTPATRRCGQLATLLRARTLVDVDSWTVVQGQPIPPGTIGRELERRLERPAQLPVREEGEAVCTF